MNSWAFKNEIWNPVRSLRAREIKYKYYGRYNLKNSKNSEQAMAIHYIINKTALPAPYILFGPPGTGKTATIVEAIAQVFIY